jgi:DNA polymerase III epsilon subunit family exonuclease
VVDLETTGFIPGTDRVVEVAVVRVERNGQQQVLETLVNPEGPVGPTEVHGIDALDVEGAPIFRDILGPLRDILDGALVVAHNAGFDVGFLESEMRYAGASYGQPWLCTLALARSLHPERRGRGSNRLETLTRIYAIRNQHAHRALGDALATRDLLDALILEQANNPQLQQLVSSLIQQTDPPRWPDDLGGYSLLAPREPALEVA